MYSALDDTVLPEALQSCQFQNGTNGEMREAGIN